MHNLDMTTGSAAIAYRGETPWHGLGEALPSGADVDRWRVAARLDWTIEGAVPLYRPQEAPKGTTLKYPARRILYRSDTGAPLSVVSDRYRVVQPGEVLEFFRDLVADHGFELETAGSLDGGRKLWALATNNTAMSLGTRMDRADPIKPYVLLATSCDGSSGTDATFTTVRVVCANTLAMTAHDRHNGVTVRHSTVFNADAVKTQLGLIDDSMAGFMGDADRMASHALSDAQAVNYFAYLYEKTDDEGKVVNEPALEKVVNNLMSLYKSGPGAELPTARGTAWGALNAVTRFVDHHAPARSVNNRFRSGQFGDGAKKKDSARVAALDIS